ncbi:hypothetical protein [Sphingomonas sp.]|uniref:hypothetical protein n=1 Tax=Sphingomonas sp. TaxID=28214 RepID=UPI003B0045F1
MFRKRLHALARCGLALPLLVPALLAGCAHQAELAVATPEPIAPPPARPELAPDLATIAPPPRGEDEAYRTINSALDPQSTMWHVRAALNVAAIGCRGPGDIGTVPAYNAMLTSKKALLAKVNTGVQAGFRAQGADGDAYMTKLYNYFAMPAAKPGFCAAAATIAPAAAAATPDAFPAFAQDALPALEAPFLAVFRQVDEYRLASAEWDRRYGPQADATRLAEAGAPMPAAPLPARETPSPSLPVRAPAALPTGTSASAGHYDLPRALSLHQGVTATASTSSVSVAPRLAYAEIGAVVAWQPVRRETLASR